MRDDASVTPEAFDGSVVVVLGSSTPATLPQGHLAELSEALGEATRFAIVDRLIEQVHGDLDDRADWEQVIEHAVELLGLDVDAAPAAADDDGMSVQVKHTLMLHALVRFVAEAGVESVGYEGPADASAIRAPNVDPADGADAAARLREWANWYLMTQLNGWKSGHDTTLLGSALAGRMAKKVYPDYVSASAPVLIEAIPVEDLIVSASSASLHDGRVTHRIHMPSSRLLAFMASGAYRTVRVRGYEGRDATAAGITETVSRMTGVGLGRESEFSALDPDSEHTIYEVHCDLRLDDDPHPRGLARPYVATIHLASRQLLALRRNWAEGDPDERRLRAFVGYPYLAGLRPSAPLGLGALLGSPVDALRMLQSEGLTAARLANHPVGVIMGAWGTAIRDRNMRLKPGEWAVIDAPVGGGGGRMFDLFPFKGADPTLLAMMERLEEQSADLAGTATINIAEAAGSNTPMGTVLAAYDASTVIPRAVHSNIYAAMSEELRLLQQHMRGRLRQPIEYAPGKWITPADFVVAELAPSMKPGATSRTRRIVEAQAIEELATKYPQLHDPRRVVERVYQALGVVDYDDLLVNPDDDEPITADPITEFNAALKGAPLAAGWAQAHDAHIAAHAASVSMLASGLADQLGEPGARAVALLQAHIGDHVIRKLAVTVAQTVGLPPDALMSGLPPALEARIAPVVADVMRQLADAMAGSDEASLAERLAEMDARAKVEIERIRGEYRLREQQMEEAGDTGRNDADNRTALVIAGMNAGAKSAATPRLGFNPGRGAPTNNPSPRRG